MLPDRTVSPARGQNGHIRAGDGTRTQHTIPRTSCNYCKQKLRGLHI